jgi:hypothetical protein
MALSAVLSLFTHRFSETTWFKNSHRIRPKIGGTLSLGFLPFQAQIACEE